MSFILKNLNADEFRQLQTMLGQSNKKIQLATIDNYKNISFTATEYELLKKSLEQHRPTSATTFFSSTSTTTLSEKLQFDFHSLITALKSFVNNFHQWDHQQKKEAWIKIGKAQRDVPAHIAQEYCRPDRSFSPAPKFNEETLPRVLTFLNHVKQNEHWFSLNSSSSKLGSDFPIIRSHGPVRIHFWNPDATQEEYWAIAARRALSDLSAVRRLDEVRIDDLTQSRENLSRPASQLSIGVQT